MAQRYFEDFFEGLTVDLGNVEFTAEGIIEFARAYDPQPMHTSLEAARKSIYGGLIASGWHTAGAYMRLLVDSVIGQSESLGSPGIDSNRYGLVILCAGGSLCSKRKCRAVDRSGALSARAAKC